METETVGLRSSLVLSLSLFLRFENRAPQFCNGSTDALVGGVTLKGSRQITD